MCGWQGRQTEGCWMDGDWWVNGWIQNALSVPASVCCVALSVLFSLTWTNLPHVWPFSISSASHVRGNPYSLDTVIVSEIVVDTTFEECLLGTDVITSEPLYHFRENDDGTPVAVHVKFVVVSGSTWRVQVFVGWHSSIPNSKSW